VLWRIARWLGIALGFVVGRLFGVRREHVMRSMARAGVDPRHASGMYASLGTGLFELILVALGRGPLVPLRMELSQVEREIERLRARGRGVVVATAHTGNWDLLACAAAERVPLHVVTKRLHVGVFDRIWQAVRRRRNVRLVQAGSAAKPLLRALGRNEVVAMLVDQAPERERATTLAAFLGATARVDLAPALVAHRARAPIAVVFSWRASDGAHRAELVRVIESRATSPAEVMTTITEDLADFVRRHPEQWLWMHRRWKDAPQVSAPELPAKSVLST
jgi:KDO2-lipid IV(A) lauroyltransferase